MMLYTILGCFTRDTGNLKRRPGSIRESEDAKQLGGKNAKAVWKNNMNPTKGKRGYINFGIFLE